MNRTFRAAILWTIVLVAVVLGSGCKKKEAPAAPAKETTMKDMQMQAEDTNKAATATAEDTNKTATTAMASIEQTTCPVTGDKIDKNVFVEYKGKKVYFCCSMCKGTFEKDPEKYVAKLPQFQK